MEKSNPCPTNAHVVQVGFDCLISKRKENTLVEFIYPRLHDVAIHRDFANTLSVTLLCYLTKIHFKLFSFGFIA